MLTVLENCRVSPPPSTVGERTFLGNNCSEPQTLIIHHSSTLRHVEGDSVAVTVAECTLDFNDLTGNHPRISIGITNHHSLCDATTRHDFLKAWSSIAMHGTDELFLASGSLPFYERVVKYPSSFDEMALKKAGISAINADYQPRQLSLSEAVKKKNGLIEDGETLIKAVFVPVPGIGVAGSTKIKIYDLDFGWGKPKKYETISIDYRSSIISVNASKESPADIEIGASLPAKQMDAFISIHSEELEGTFY
ncbi:hypothetical protein L2E82_35130 [Cichorium intybus]|uniref:Uncharacterized protein n=1 Tax=Cichorium intybus TaxID=13427 RepID=A0ACB9BNB9_CICIN|nr:hypothetical protein L2E82_35130 [Cichorium intybus]